MFCTGVCMACSISTPGGDDSMAFSLLHNLPKTTSDSSGNQVRRASLLSVWGIFHSATGDHTSVGLVGGMGVSSLPMLCACLELQDRQRERQTGRRQLPLPWEAQCSSRLRE